MAPAAAAKPPAKAMPLASRDRGAARPASSALRGSSRPAARISVDTPLAEGSAAVAGRASGGATSGAPVTVPDGRARPRRHGRTSPAREDGASGSAISTTLLTVPLVDVLEGER